MHTQRAVLNRRMAPPEQIDGAVNIRFFRQRRDATIVCVYLFKAATDKPFLPTTTQNPLLMLRLSWLALAMLILSDLSSLAQAPAKLRRSESFFGVHFDLHATEDITDAGRTLTPAMVDTFLRKVRPDFIQIDCKGHPGITSYPTKAGYHVKGFDKDPLRIFRDVTERHRVGLYMHYSGVWDGKVATARPEWAMVRTNGEKNTQKISFFSPYLDSIVIPQLKELAGDYKVDGAWIDGDCWAVETDYSEAAIRAWKQQTGYTDVPRKREDPHYAEYLEFTRELFRKYMGKYIDAIHAYNPKFQITSNWSYSSHMPEPVLNNVDYLSGDVTPQDGVYRSAFEARALAPQGKPWDLMSWGFSWNGAKMPMSNKSAIQLKQEAAEVIAMGGGIQFYYTQNRDLSLKPWLADILKELGDFARARQPFTHKANAIPQVALLFPTRSYRKQFSAPFPGAPAKLQATLYTLLDNQLPVELLMEHHLTGRMQQYKMIVIPECQELEPALVDELRNYVKNGGKLLTIGAETAKIFASELGIASSEKKEEDIAFISAAGRLGGIRSPRLNANLTPDAKALSHFYRSNDYVDRLDEVAASVRNLGKGRIAAVYFDAGSAYADYKSPALRDFIASAVEALQPERKVEVKGSHLVHVALNELKGRTFINLINIAGEHTNRAAIGYDQVPPLTDIRVHIKGKPALVRLQPEGKDLPLRYANGITTVTLPKVEIHSILEVIDP